MNIFVVCLVFCLSSLNLLGQEGYLGEKFIISLDATGNTPILSGYFKEGTFTSKQNKMVPTKDWFDYGFGGSLFRNINKRLNIGISYNAKFLNVKAPSYYTTYYVISPQESSLDTTWLRMQALNCVSHSFLAVAEFYTLKGLAPVGFHHELGLGVSYTKITQRSYDYAINEFGNTEVFEDKWTTNDHFLYAADLPAYMSLTLLYGIGMRLPLTDHLSIDYGVKYLFNVYLKPKDLELLSIEAQPFNYGDLFYDLQRRNVMSLNLKVGVSYLF